MVSLLDNLRTLVRYRWLLYELVARDLKLRYRGSLLGVFWTLLNPLLFLAIYTLVFSVILKSSIRDFPLFLLAGMVPFFWFSAAIGTAATSISSAAGYVGKTLLPTELLVYVPVLSNGVNFLITIALLFPVSIFLGVNVLWALLFLVPLLIVELLMTLGFSLLVATANVFYRDWQQIVGYILTALFFLTPIFYAKGSIPANLQFLVTFSPIAALIAGYQSIFYYGAHPAWHDLLFAGAFSAIVLVVSMAVFNRYRDAFGEYV
jgi:lipopolysaccharide transport system permease protein